jgi:hypothetical protein
MAKTEPLVWFEKDPAGVPSLFMRSEKLEVIHIDLDDIRKIALMTTSKEVRTYIQEVLLTRFIHPPDLFF